VLLLQPALESNVAGIINAKKMSFLNMRNLGKTQA
jgi:hypothetical protein